MKNCLFFLSIILFSFFSCTENSSSSSEEVWELVSQVVEVQDTTYVIDKNGVITSQVAHIDIMPIPIRTQSQETWTFKNNTLRIVTDLGKGNIQNIEYQVINQKDGFSLKRKNENQFCKILKKNEKEMILETSGKIILKRIDF